MANANSGTGSHDLEYHFGEGVRQRRSISPQTNVRGREGARSFVQEKVAESPKLKKVAIVTESTEGIGFSIAERLGLDGARIVVSSSSVNQEKGAVKKLEREGIEAKWIQCDISKAKERERLISETIKVYGEIDVIVSNTIVPGMPKDIGLQSFTAFMKEAKAGVRKGFSFVLVTEAERDEYEELAFKIKSLANDMFQQQVRVNCVASFPMPMSADKIQGKVRTEECMAAAAALLAADKSSKVSGVTLVVAEEDIARFNMKSPKLPGRL